MTNVTKVVHRRDFIKFSALMYMQKEFVLVNYVAEST